MSKAAKRLVNQLAPWALPVLLIVIWQIASQTGLLSTSKHLKGWLHSIHIY